jgi:hypothetical protein
LHHGTRLIRRDGPKRSRAFPAFRSLAIIGTLFNLEARDKGVAYLDGPGSVSSNPPSPARRLDVTESQLHAPNNFDPCLRSLGDTLFCVLPGGRRRGDETIVDFARAQTLEPNSDPTGDRGYEGQ